VHAQVITVLKCFQKGIASQVKQGWAGDVKLETRLRCSPPEIETRPRRNVGLSSQDETRTRHICVYTDVIEVSKYME